MVCIGATIGKAGFTAVEITTNQQINSLTPAEGYDGEFIYYQFLTPTFQQRVLHASGQATLPIINKSKWSELTIAMPQDVATQKAIAEKLRDLRTKVDNMIDVYAAKLGNLADLRHSLLRQAFAGQLT